ncbi:MAG: HSP90 family protein [Propionibacteriaceae bacterium]|nr:HSP90 family protein [Propionibacteriaceae bacterium]
MTQPNHAFQVDLHGVVDLFAHHLYSSPRVYLRELLQNAVDAITARRLSQPDCDATIRLCELDGGGLQVRDSGIGLTSQDAADLLATIGRSSKRVDDLESTRGDYLGQFGIGLLSAFMVAEQIEMYCRSARDLTAAPIVWRGSADGTYTLDEISLDEYVGATGGQAPGSTVRLRPRRDQEHWLSAETVQVLASDFGSLLPIDVAIEVHLGDGETLWRRLTEPQLPWQVHYSSSTERAAALATYCAKTLGFQPLTSFDLSVPVVGLTGVAFVLPVATSPASQNTHRVYLKQMLVGAQVPQLLPPWAFFVRCVVNSSALRPTASREALYEDDVLLATREALGRLVRDWMVGVLSGDGAIKRQFVRTHHLAIRSLALHDDDMLDLAATVLPFETTLGEMTLADFVEDQGCIRYTTTVEDFRRIAPVARAQGLGIVNAGYVYDSDLLERLATRRPAWQVRALAASDVEQTLTVLEPAEELSCLDYLLAASPPLRELDCDLLMRRFEPNELPALFMTDSNIEHQRALRQTRDDVGGLWGGLLDDFTHEERRRRLVLNFDNSAVQALVACADEDVQTAGTRSLYVTARLLAGEPLRPRDAHMMNDALSALLRKTAK